MIHAVAVLLLAAGSLAGCAPGEGTSEPVVDGVIRHYIRSNTDGSQPEHVVQFRPSRTDVAVYKWVAKCETAAFVTALLAPAALEPERLDAGKVGPDGGQVKFGSINADLAARTLSVEIDGPDGPVRDTAQVPAGIPWFLFDYDLADLNAYLQERKPVAAFEFAWALVRPEGDDLLSFMAHVEARPAGTEVRRGIATRHFALTLTEGRSGTGNLWIDEASGAIVEADVTVPNHPGLKDYRLVLERVEGGGSEGWRRLLAGHYRDCLAS